MKTILLLLLAAAITLFLIAFKHSRLPSMINESFATMAQSRNAKPVTEGSIAPLCPPGFKFFTDDIQISINYFFLCNPSCRLKIVADKKPEFKFIDSNLIPDNLSIIELGNFLILFTFNSKKPIFLKRPSKNT